MSETKKSAGGGWLGVTVILALLVCILFLGALAGNNSARARFERHGYVLIQGIDGEKVATVTPIFEEWRR